MDLKRESPLLEHIITLSRVLKHNRACISRFDITLSTCHFSCLLLHAHHFLSPPPKSSIAPPLGARRNPFRFLRPSKLQKHDEDLQNLSFLFKPKFMEARICMNTQCGAAATSEWKKGWPLRCGELVILCNKCGSAYEQSIFCEVFHSNESGWRECTSCGKRLHCGCIVSRILIELLDRGGVNCINCSKHSELNSIHDSHKPDGYNLLKVNSVSTLHPLLEQSHSGEHNIEETNLLQLGSNAHGLGLKHVLQLQKEERGTSFGKIKQEGVLDVGKAHALTKDSYESMAQTNLSISLGPSVDPSLFPGAMADERDKALPVFQQVLKSRQLLPKPPRSELASFLEPNASMMPHIRVARPPAEGRGKSQLLPRYWPRITDQELLQISGDSNSTIVPLFEKVLSASDAGRIGRLVLPKACAEAYFPPISQPEGLPLKIQDIKGKEWVFQFRFWPNNNSRMYVLEGVTPCIQSMQLQAGDTVTFSRMDPEGKLVMGFRKATNSATIQGSGDPHLNALTKHLGSANGCGINWHKFEKHENMTNESLLLQSMLGPDRKRSRNIGSKNKRLLIDSLDVLELKLTWEEVQDLLRPPSGIEPSIVTIEDHDFEEYDVCDLVLTLQVAIQEPPVFGKSTIFILRPTGGQEQWAQCDSCSKWRRLPIQALLPPKWMCADNIWDQSRSSCAAPDELTLREQETLVKLSKEFKRQRIVGSDGPVYRHEATGITALPNTAIDGDNAGEAGPTSVGATTKHPRHRPGCSCIVCIQPPSGKGKHKPTCTCNVCLTVKRRFKTLMMRKKKRQSEREAEIVVQRNQQHTSGGSRDETEADNVSQHLSSLVDSSDNEARSANVLDSEKIAELGTRQLDLNCQPFRFGEASRMGLSRVSMMSLLQVANLPLELYLKQNGLTSLASEQQPNCGTQPEHEDTKESEKPVKEDQQFDSAGEEQENGNAETRHD